MCSMLVKWSLTQCSIHIWFSFHAMVLILSTFKYSKLRFSDHMFNKAYHMAKKQTTWSCEYWVMHIYQNPRRGLNQQPLDYQSLTNSVIRVISTVAGIYPYFMAGVHLSSKVHPLIISPSRADRESDLPLSIPKWTFACFTGSQLVICLLIYG